VNLAPPQRGDVIRYAYLWADEGARGREDARKDRPAVVIAVSVTAGPSQTRVLALAVTHTPPKDPFDAVAFPAHLKSAIGLDERPAWVITTEANAFAWPGPDIRPVPGRAPPVVIYGRMSSALTRKVVESYLANRTRQRARLVQRTE
jgi:hypothetical protein